MTSNEYAVIMAGGGGTRLWPLSRRDRPKQMLSLGGTRSLFQIAVDRLEGIIPPERILVVTVEDQARALKEQCPEIPAENFLLEPMPRGTAAVVGYAAAVLQHKDPDSAMAVLTADHIIGNLGLFQDLLRAGFQAAGDGHLVTLGIKPSYPATGYGYIHRGKLAGRYQNLDIFQVEKFTEKPDLSEARRMLDSADYDWNSGMFIWRTDVILAEIQRQMPDLHTRLTRIMDAWETPEQERTIRNIWPDIERQTVDYGIMENARQVAVIPAEELAWNDVGSWEALFDVLPSDQSGNIIQGPEHLGLETADSLVFSDQGGRVVVTIGIENLVIVDTGDILLVCSRDKAQDVRQAVKMLENEDRQDLL